MRVRISPSARKHLVAAPDKFRGTASAAQVAAAVAAGATRAGWTTDQAPMADGGEGTLETVGGQVRHTTVAGPLGELVEAEWRLMGTTAVIEMARAAGRQLLPHPVGDQPLRADTRGVGQLVLAAVDAGAQRVVVAVGGAATTDGGWGAVSAIGGAYRLGKAELVVACDVVTPFRQAAAVFGPQKGARPDQVAELSRRLDALAERYRDMAGIDVDRLAGSGAAGGLAGGLAALGARLVPGFDLVAGLVGLQERMGTADLVVTGEGHLDEGSLAGKVVGGVVAMAGRPVLCVVGDADPATAGRLRRRGVVVVSLVERFGEERARRATVDAVAEVVAGCLPA